MSESEAAPIPVRHPGILHFNRLDRGLEFARVATFIDAVYAIALTLIAVELRPPPLNVQDVGQDGGRALWDALNHMAPEIIIFFIAFAVMGSYWLASHRFFAGLRSVDSRFVFWVLPYLAFVAFLPFPAAMMGNYSENPVAVASFAVTVAAVSFLEWCLLWRAHASNLFFAPLTPAGFRWASIGSLLPVFLFLVSIPVMFIDTYLGMAVWALNIPGGIFLNSRMPELQIEPSDVED